MTEAQGLPNKTSVQKIEPIVSSKACNQRKANELIYIKIPNLFSLYYVCMQQSGKRLTDFKEYCKGHQKEDSQVSKGNALVNEAA